MKPKKYLSKSKIVQMEAQALRIHPKAQRTIVPSKLKRLCEELDLDAIGVLHAVPKYRGQYGPWIVDGQHRVSALMKRGMGDFMVDVQVHLDAIDEPRASAVFLGVNDRAAVRPFDKFLNQLRAKDPVALGIQRLCQKRDLKIYDSKRDGQIACVVKLQKIYSLNGGTTLSDALDIALSAWGRTTCAVEGVILGGLAVVLTECDESVDRQRLIRKMAKYPGGAGTLIGDSKPRRRFGQLSASRAVAGTIIDQYNVGLRLNKLERL